MNIDQTSASFAHDYLYAIETVRNNTRQKLASLTPYDSDKDRLYLNYQYARTNLLHILNLNSQDKNESLATSIIEGLMINRNIEHTSEFFPSLCEYISVNDPGEVLASAQSGHTYFFLGFHTGPYWSNLASMLIRNISVAVLFHSQDVSSRRNILSVYDALKKRYRFTASIHLLEIDQPNFLTQAKHYLSEGYQLLVYIDGYGVYERPNKAKDAEIPFLNSRICVKTTVTRLASIFKIPIVTFNAAHVQGNVARDVYIDFPIDVDRFIKDTGLGHESLVNSLFSKLASRLVLCPDQWEGWIYFHKFFSQSYVDDLIKRKPQNADGHKRDRLFIAYIDGEKTVVDRMTYQSYRLSDVHTQRGDQR